MMCEGAYLYMILFNTLENDKRRLRLLMVIGWGLPIIAVMPTLGIGITFITHHHDHKRGHVDECDYSSQIKIPRSRKHKQT
jgi:hypothetical protein